MIIGITGGTGCGKTTVLKLLAQQGAVILDCDAIYHRLLETDPTLLQAIGSAFPGVVQEGKLDRKALGSRVFSDREALLTLNRITHGAVKGEVEKALAQKPALAAIDAIALFESGLAELCHVTLAVTAPTSQRVQRLMLRDGISESYAQARILAQPSQDWFREKCDHVLENDGSQADFQKKCLAFFSQLGIMKP